MKSLLNIIFLAFLGLLVAGAVIFAKADDALNSYHDQTTIGDTSITACKHAFYFFIGELLLCSAIMIVLSL